jgi:predicted glycosyltransferase
MPKSVEPYRVALYSHDTQGLGHIRRNLAIAGAFAQLPNPPTTLLVAGISVASSFQLPEGSDLLVLPAVSKDPKGHYRARNLRVSLDQVIRLRGQTIRAALADFTPDVFIVDKVPGGLQNELLPTLRMLRRQGVRCVLGLRDILDDPTTTRNEWAQMNYTKLIETYYDAVWVYGDPAIYDPVRRYNLPHSVATKIRYTGYLDRTQLSPNGSTSSEVEALLPAPHEKLALCMLGGGEDGANVALAFAQAHLPPATKGILITGPYMPAPLRQKVAEAAHARTDLQVVDFLTNPEQLLAHASVVVSMGGYNSLCEILAHRVRALIVPRVHPRREQLERALHLQARGAVGVLLPDDVTPAALTTWLAEELALDRPATHSVDLQGLQRLPALLQEIVNAPTRDRIRRFFSPFRLIEQSASLLAAETILAVNALLRAS